MSWKHTKKINSDMKKPLDRLIEEKTNLINNSTNDIKNLIGTNNSFSGVDFSNATLMQKINCLLASLEVLQYTPSNNEKDILFSNLNEFSREGSNLGSFTPKFSGNLQIEIDFSSNYEGTTLQLKCNDTVTLTFNDYSGNYKKRTATLNVKKSVPLRFTFDTAGGLGVCKCRNLCIKAKEIINY